MADGQMSIDEVRDMLRYLEDRNDYLADPFSRAGMGSGFFNEESFKPKREYVPNPTPVENLLRGYSANPTDTVESLIADEILAGGSPLSAIAKLQQIYNQDPEGFGASIPTYTNQGVTEPDWKLVQSTADKLWNDFQAEQQSLGEYMQDEQGYYTETPSEAAEKFRALGLPLPTEQYTDQLYSPAQDRAGMEEERAMMSQMLGEANNQRIGSQNAYDQAQLDSMGSPFVLGRDTTAPGSPADTRSTAERAMGIGDQTFRDVADAGNWFLDDMGALEDKVNSWLPDWTTRNVGGGDKGMSEQEQMESQARALGLSPDLVTPALMEALGEYNVGTGDVAKAGRKRAEDRALMTEIMQGRAQTMTDRHKAFWNTYDEDELDAAGQAFAARDAGQTPLSDLFGTMTGGYGFDAGFAPQYENVGGQAYLKADKRNPNYKANKRAAFQEYWGSR